MYIILTEEGAINSIVNEQPKEDILFTEKDYADFANSILESGKELNLRWDFKSESWINLT